MTLVKPENSRWTDDQWRAIAEKGQDMLVAAAAGSGKTAVLVERIIRKITDPNDPVDVDRLLIVTFTNAAAAEMRVRIGQALEKELAKKPGDLRLRNQLTLLNKAQITTSHSFCLSVVRKYYYQLDIDPAFRIGDQAEMELIREDVLEGLFEDYYGAQDSDLFYELVDRYSNDRSDTELIQLVQKLYDFSRSHPWPEAWLDEMAAAYHVDEGTTVDDLPWTPDLKGSIQETIVGLLKILDTAENLASEPGGPYPYIETLQKDRELLEKMAEVTQGPWEALYQAFSTLAFSKLKPCRGDDIDENLKERTKGLRDDVKKKLTQLQEELFSKPPEAYLEDLHDMAPYVALLVHLVKDFSERYRALKKEKALVDFDDLEHFTLHILRSPEAQPGQEVSSDIAKQYRAQFLELLVDEYQDTNLVQETIISHIARGNNTFMVGDVKQSIYRFRLAEPGLFLEKYKQFIDENKAGATGYRIDLSQNFRSRREILDGTNFIFKQVMDEAVGEIDYDANAELKFGASYYPEANLATELHLIDRHDKKAGLEDEELEEYQTAELEGHFIANQIQKLITEGMEVYDKETEVNRPIQYRDVVILLRSAASWAPTIMDVLKQRGIPTYAELATGYFEAIEVSVMMSLLRTIDNPYQDIPLASVLRSPLVQLSGAELARIRIVKKDVPYYEAIKEYVNTFEDELTEKLTHFLTRLKKWRGRARSGALADLIWQLYRETGYYEYVAGLSGGEQRQANLRALYDRARQYEQTSFRGLFRFLRFIERLQDRGGDLGEARALSEQEDVVRVMTIHKSKGLEFPVVFVAGLNKRFNFRDLNSKTLLHKSLGFGTKNIDPVRRFTLPTLPHAALRRKMAGETVAEELRILYVALTRAREKLYLVGTLKESEKVIQKWRAQTEERAWLLPSFPRSQAKTYLDWIGPAVSRHRHAITLHEAAQFTPFYEGVKEHPSEWFIALHAGETVVPAFEQQEMDNREREEKLRHGLPVDVNGEKDRLVAEQLSWRYPHQEATERMAKQTVTEIKRQQERFNEGFDEILVKQFRRPIGERPRFLTEESMTAAERGTSVHKFMQHVRLLPSMSEPYLQEECSRMVTQEMLTPEEGAALDLEAIHHFYETTMGQEILTAPRVVRELSFSLALNTSEVYKDWQGNEEKLLVQGVIDCLYENEKGLTLLDYKTDQLQGRFHTPEDAQAALISRYRKQLELYRIAIERIWKQKVHCVGLYAFDGGFFLEI
ncbi:ATP-dependent helicase/nuclease subunit A [Pullulanibacillus pueri]|uniref:ATP-dependent helicase/nuclease subunit A n=1 Tax=Pullulanibacillus pueri TaxID=1437324 RepID=A0A8J3ENC0_9BACL|nr:helicase-exonuclease AddAB subunit AddA [Pullulanibacillus pueri]MBM7680538.1 ATP-dependent helicase/nuclease subunit A [Pullulanibacillus pueri]GGH86157.1 ATP-dependent helicase/nuclease subunit A [Pullulanibacillus pueri]